MKEIRESAYKAVRELLEAAGLEKGDILAVVLSGVVMFVLPVMGVMALACMIAYFVFAQ